jgi:ribosomal protein L35AE/L33A
MVVLCLTNRSWSTLNPLSAIIDLSTATTGTEMSIQSINAEIVAGNFSNEQLSSIIDAVKYARTQLAKRNKASLMLGDSVEFTNSRTGRVMRGHVKKIAIKYVTVDTGAGAWRVPASMLKAVA